MARLRPNKNKNYKILKLLTSIVVKKSLDCTQYDHHGNTGVCVCVYVWTRFNKISPAAHETEKNINK